MEKDKILKRIEAASRSCTSIENVTKYVNEINEGTDFDKGIMFAFLRTMNTLFPLWNEDQKNEALGLMCIKLSIKVFSMLSRSTCGEEDEFKALKMLCFSLAQAHRMSRSASVICELINSTLSCFSRQRTLGSEEMRGKCIASLVQLSAGLGSQFKPSLIYDEVELALVATVTVRLLQCSTFNDLRNSGVDIQKLLSYGLLSFALLSLNPSITNSVSAVSIRSEIMRHCDAFSVSVCPIVDQITSLLNSSFRQWSSSGEKVMFDHWVSRSCSIVEFIIAIKTQNEDETWKLFSLGVCISMNASQLKAADSAENKCLRLKVQEMWLKWEKILPTLPLLTNAGNKTVAECIVSILAHNRMSHSSLLGAFSIAKLELQFQLVWCLLAFNSSGSQIVLDFLDSVEAGVASRQFDMALIESTSNFLRCTQAAILKLKEGQQGIDSVKIGEIVLKMLSVCSRLFLQFPESSFSLLLSISKSFVHILHPMLPTKIQAQLWSTISVSVLSIFRYGKQLLQDGDWSQRSSQYCDFVEYMFNVLSLLSGRLIGAEYQQGGIESLMEIVELMVFIVEESFMKDDTIRNIFVGTKSEALVFKPLGSIGRMIGTILGVSDASPSVIASIQKISLSRFGKWILTCALHHTDLTAETSSRLYKWLYSRECPLQPPEKSIYALSLLSQTRMCDQTEALLMEDMKTIVQHLPVAQTDLKRQKSKSNATELPSEFDATVLQFHMYASVLRMLSCKEGNSLLESCSLSTPTSCVAGALKSFNAVVNFSKEFKRVLELTSCSLHLVHVVLSLPEDIAALYHYLQLSGRTKDQDKVVSEIERLVAVSLECTGFLKNIWVSCLVDIILSDQFNRSWENRGQTSNNCLCSLELCPTDSIFMPFYAWIRQVSSFIKDCEVILKTLSAKCTQSEFCDELQRLVNVPLPHRELGFNRNFNSSLYLRAWISLLGSRVLSLYWGNHRSSFDLAYQAMTFVNSNSGDRKSTIGMIGVKAEVLVQLAELHEIGGDADNASNYFSRASSFAKRHQHFFALKSTVDFHSCRLWFRTNSSRFILAITGVAEEILSMEGQPEYENDWKSKQLRLAAREVIAALGVEHEETCNWPVSNGSISYRYLNRYWNLQDRGDKDNSQFIHAAPVGSVQQIQLEGVINKCLKFLRSEDTVWTSGAQAEPVEGMEMLFESLQALQNFDALRDIRRLACSNRIAGFFDTSSSSSSSSDNTFRAFVNGASSIGVSHELTEMLSSRKDSKETNASLIQAACAGDAMSLAEIRDMFQVLALRNSHNGVAPILIFACIEPANGNLVLGRLDIGKQQTPVLVSLPVGSLLTNIIETWEATISRLHQQLNASKSLNNLTEKDKRKWWKEREDIDRVMDSLLFKLQEILGPWRSILSPFATEQSNVGDNQASEDLRNALASLSINDENNNPNVSRTKKPSKGKKQEATKPAAEVSPNSTKDAWKSILKAVQHSGNSNFSLTDTELEAVCSLIFGSESTAAMNSIRGNESLSVTSSANKVDLTVEMLSSKTVAELKEILSQRGISCSARKKADIIDAILASAPSLPSTAPATTTYTQQESHLILLLDERLQQIPLECMPCLRGHNVSRVPSMTVLLHLLQQRRQSETCNSTNIPSTGRNGVKKADGGATESQVQVPLANCWYAIDPESNLPTTRETMSRFIEPYCKKWKWKGTIAAVPDQSTVKSSLEESDLFIFCGHGDGKVLFNGNPMNIARWPTALWLWGCSSGRFNRAGVHDPIGRTLDFLKGGSQQIIANLWDVTDKDIDKLSVECMKGVFECSSGSQPVSNACTSLARSRDVCKFKYANGSASVVYGLPIGFTDM